MERRRLTTDIGSKEGMDRRETGRHLLKNLFGSTSWRTIGLILLGVTLISWVADASYHLITAGFGRWGPGVPLGAMLLLVVALGALVGLVAWAKKRGEHLAQRHRVWPDIDEPPRSARALILYLSPLTKPEFREGVNAWLAEAQAGDELDATVPDGCQWRMPVAGIKPHERTLERVVVIPSSDSEFQGTWRDFPWFRRFLEHRFPQLVGRIHSISEFLGSEGYYEKGVAYNDVKALVTATDRVYDELLNEDPAWEREGRILVDVTSGTGETSVAGTLVTLARNRRFQHVNTADHTPRTYDIAYEPPEEE